VAQAVEQAAVAVSDIPDLRARLAVLRELNVGVYNVERAPDGTILKEHIQLFAPAVPVPQRSPKEIDDAERAAAARMEEWEARVTRGASGGLRETKNAPSSTAGGGSVNPALNDAIRRERKSQQGAP